MKDKMEDSELQLRCEIERLRQYDINDLVDYPYDKHDRLHFNLGNLKMRLRQVMCDLSCLQRQVTELRREYYEKRSH